jgi:hypothetical protein
MKNNKQLFVTIFILLVCSSFVLGYGNSRLGDGILENEEVDEQILELAKCYSLLNKIDDKISFDNYYLDFSKNGLPEECAFILEGIGGRKVWFEEHEDGFVDTDLDQFTDEEEKMEGTDPNDYDSFPWWIDFDGDGYTNDFELMMYSDPLSDFETPDWQDSDMDGFSDEFEISHKTNSQNSEDFPGPESFIEKEVQKPTAVSQGNWQIYLAMALGVLLLIFIIIYVYYHEKYVGD